MNSSLGDPDWQMLCSKVSEVQKTLAIPLLQAFLPVFQISMLLPKILSSFFWQSLFKISCSASAEALQRLRDTSGFMSQPPILVLFCLFHKSVMVLPVFSSWPAGTLLLEAFPGALWQCWAHCAPRQPPVLAGAWDSAHGPVWIRPLVFFQAISLIVEIILNSVLDCRILAIPCSFSLHQ